MWTLEKFELVPFLQDSGILFSEALSTLNLKSTNVQNYIWIIPSRYKL